MQYAKKLQDALAKGVLCRNLKKVLKNNGKITVDKDGLLSIKTLSDRAKQVVVPKCYKQAILCYEHYLAIARHPRTRRVYDVFRKTNYWSYTATDVQKFMSKCDF